MRYGRNIFLEQYDPTIEGASYVSPSHKVFAVSIEQV